MKTTMPFWAMAATCCILGAASARADLITFEGLPLGPGVPGAAEYGSTGTYYWNGSNSAGSFTAAGSSTPVTLSNSYDTTYGSWDGFAYSNTTDTTSAGFANQYSSAAGTGAGGSSKYAVGFQPYFGEWAMNFTAPVSLIGGGMNLTNTTYAYLSMLNGDFYSKKFGGATGDDQDWFKLTISGWNGVTLLGTVDFYLADYRFANNAQDYVLSSWTNVDLSSFGGNVSKLTFALSSSDNGMYGMNTPAYFAADDIVAFAAVPEPAAVAALVGVLPLALALRRRLARRKE
jgi:Domain of unknown function (DUF4465)